PTPRMANVRRCPEPKGLNELVEVLAEVAQAVAGGRLVGCSVAAEGWGDDMIAVLEVLGDAAPRLPEAGPAVDEEHVRVAGVAPPPVVHPDTLDFGELALGGLRGRHEAPPRKDADGIPNRTAPRDVGDRKTAIVRVLCILGLPCSHCTKLSPLDIKGSFEFALHAFTDLTLAPIDTALGSIPRDCSPPHAVACRCQATVWPTRSCPVSCGVYGRPSALASAPPPDQLWCARQ